MLGYMLVFVLLVISLASAQIVTINEMMSANVSVLQDEDGDYSDWIELYNPGNLTVNLIGYGLSDKINDLHKWQFPNLILAGGDYLVVFASGKDRSGPEYHTNFKIKSSGESLFLTDPSGEIVDNMDAVALPSDISFGRDEDLPTVFYYFNNPTPGSPNTSEGFAEISDPPSFSQEGGFYTAPTTVTITSPSSEAVIRYTLDGSPPTDSSLIYTSPIFIDSTRVIRARSFEPGKLFSEIITNSYIFYDNTGLPVISLSTDPDNLFDEDIGIYVVGSNYNPSIPQSENFWQDWERPVHVEFFEPTGVNGFSDDYGISIYGGVSRNKPQKSLAIACKDRYCSDIINYQIFPDNTQSEFKSFVLRNSGNDWGSTFIRDALMTSLLYDTDVDYQSYRPAITYINGEYWGIYNIREKLNLDYIVTNYNADDEYVDFLEYECSETVSVINGDSSAYIELLNFVETHNMNDSSNYQYVADQIEIINYIDYFAAQNYYAMGDWPWNNSKFWRTNTPPGKWDWLLFDTDYGFGLFDIHPFDYNKLSWLVNPTGSLAITCLLFSSLLENTFFRNNFINHSADLMNVNFKLDTVFQRIDAIRAIIEPEMPSHKNRWNQSMNYWYDQLEVLYEFAEHRSDFVREQIIEEFELSGLANVLLDIEPQGSCRIKISSKEIEGFPWEGIYFKDVPIQITAIPNPGYRFLSWVTSQGQYFGTLNVILTNDFTGTAYCEIDSSVVSTVVINEINYNSIEDFNPKDWVELYNYSGNSIGLSDWVFKDANDDNSFIFPDGFILEPYGHLVLCKDTSSFSECFPQIDSYIGNMDFNLSNGGELIRLFDETGTIIDSLTYDDEPPWPTEPDGMGKTLELIDPFLPNHYPASWRASFNDHGSPGGENVYTSAERRSTGALPDGFRLSPAYPNPFNATTVISFELRDASFVSLAVYDITGREVSTLVNGFESAGVHSVIWDAEVFSSGIYFVRLEVLPGAGTRQHEMVGKMLLVK